MNKKKFINTPLNYTGNKYRILDQILPLFPNNINRFIDLCCGSSTVGINALDISNEVICLDINMHVINLLQTLLLFSESSILSKVEDIINTFELSNSYHFGYEIYKDYIKGNNGLKEYNKNGYLKLRQYFNTTTMSQYNKSFHLLVLLSYCFNNDMRFNSSNNFNMPVGKTDFNANMRDKLHSFKYGTQNKNIKYYVADFSIIKEFELTMNDFVYIDPPYLLSNAVYNENNLWNDILEKKLLDTLSYLNSINIKFALSNILSKNDKANNILYNWVKDNKFMIIDIDYHYRSASYNKKNRSANEREVVILNYEP